MAGVMDDQAQRDRRRSLTSDPGRKDAIPEKQSNERGGIGSVRAREVARIDDGGRRYGAKTGLNFRG